MSDPETPHLPADPFAEGHVANSAELLAAYVATLQSEHSLEIAGLPVHAGWARAIRDDVFRRLSEVGRRHRPQ